MDKIITIFGTAKAKAGDETFETAYRLGKCLVQKGYVIANGGYGGTMLAAARGASEAGGKVIGVTCSAFGRKGANEYISEEYTTDSLQERLEKLIALGEAYIVLPGGTGTLLELAEVWELKNKGFFESPKPVILIGEFWRPLLDLIETQDIESTGHVDVVNNIDEAIEIINTRL